MRLMHESPTSIRLPDDSLKRAERLVPRLNKMPVYAAMGMTRHKVLRLAVAKGLEALEAEVKRQRRKR